MKAKLTKKRQLKIRNEAKLIGFLFILLMLPLALYGALSQTTYTQKAQTRQDNFYATTASKCFYEHLSCPAIPCHGNNCQACGDILVCPSTTPMVTNPSIQPTMMITQTQNVLTTASPSIILVSPNQIEIQPTCVPRPKCRGEGTGCLLSNINYCLVTPTPASPTLTPPPGCYFSLCTRVCPLSDPACCKNTLLCPSTTPNPAPQCIQRPVCLSQIPSCKIAEPKEGWCPVVSGIPTESQVDSLLIYLNTLLRGLLGINPTK